MISLYSIIKHYYKNKKGWITNMANFKNVILKKKIDNVVYDLLVKTSVSQVAFDDTTTLSAKMTTMLSDITDSKAKLTTLLGADEATSITGQIETAVNALRDALTDEADASSLSGKIKALQEAIAAINDPTDGILVTAKTYTDDKIGLSGTAYTNVKDYVDAAKAEINASIAGAFYFKGSVDYASELPDVDMSAGDVYQVKYAGTSGTVELSSEFAYDGTTWVELGSIVDLSAYYTSAQVTTAINAAKTEAIQTAAADATTKANAAQAAAIQTAATDATTKANAAQAAAEATASAALTTAVGQINTTMEGKARFLVGTVIPEDLTEADLFALIVE
jgi:hypothetical protein